MAIDLFIAAGEMSGDLHGAKLIQEILAQKPNLKIGAVAGPRMRKCPIQECFPMEKLQVMGFIDVILALPKLMRHFFTIRNQILKLCPKAVVFIDYPGLHLRLERSLRKKGYKGKLVHMICPSVWVWGKKRISLMEKNLDLLFTIFPFEKICFEHTFLKVRYIGHPLSVPIAEFRPKGKFQGQKILGLFPGSRKKVIERNLPYQLEAARRLKKLDPSLKIAISAAKAELPPIPDALLVPPEDNYELMRACHMAIAASGTVTLELALHKIPTVVTYAIRAIDRFLAQKIFHIDLPFYCIVNIVASKQIFPELFGPNLNEEQLFFWARTLWFDPNARRDCLAGCREVRKSLGMKRAAVEAAKALFSIVDF